LPRRTKPVFRSHGHSPLQSEVNRVREFWATLSDARHWSGALTLKQFDPSHSLKRERTGQEQKSDLGQSIHVRRRNGLLKAGELLGRQVVRIAEAHLFRAPEAKLRETGNPDVASAVQQNMFWVNVAMDDVAPMGVIQSGSHTTDDADDFRSLRQR